MKLSSKEMLTMKKFWVAELLMLALSVALGLLSPCHFSSRLKISISLSIQMGLELEVPVGTNVRDGFGTTRMVNWAGCVIQEPHPAVRALSFLPKEGHGVYVARWCHGSPVHRYGLYALQWIIEVNGNPTLDLETFIEASKALEHGDFVPVKTVPFEWKASCFHFKAGLALLAHLGTGL